MDRQRVLERYTRVAPHYDRMVPLWASLVFFPIERYRRQAVAALKVGPGDTVLELGCGTGANFPYIQEQIGPRGRLIALDYTPAMLDQARLRAERRGWRNVEFVQGDAAEVESLVSGPVDGAISTFCLSIVPDWRQAIAGAAALLRPGGRLVVLDGSVRPRGLLRLAWPALKWWTGHYGFADPEVDFREIPWRDALETHLTGVRYREMYSGAVALCYGEKPGPRKGGAMAKDPVCGMDVDEAKAAAKSDYQGVTYYFCAPGCKKEFDQNPEKYVKKG